MRTEERGAVGGGGEGLSTGGGRAERQCQLYRAKPHSDQQLICVYGLVWYSVVFCFASGTLNSYELKIHSHQRTSTESPFVHACMHQHTNNIQREMATKVCYRNGRMGSVLKGIQLRIL